jgi:predicted nucleotidyltransferase
MTPVVQQIAREYKTILQDVYGDDLAEVILFGSYARGDQHEESDVDFAVVFRNEDIRPTAQLFKTAPIASDLSLKYGLMVSTLPISLEKKENSMLGIYQEIRKDGIII